MDLGCLYRACEKPFNLLLCQKPPIFKCQPVALFHVPSLAPLMKIKVSDISAQFLELAPIVARVGPQQLLRATGNRGPNSLKGVAPVCRPIAAECLISPCFRRHSGKPWPPIHEHQASRCLTGTLRCFEYHAHVSENPREGNLCSLILKHPPSPNIKHGDIR